MLTDVHCLMGLIRDILHRQFAKLKEQFYLLVRIKIIGTVNNYLVYKHTVLSIPQAHNW